MIKNIKLFVNNNSEAIEFGKVVKNKFLNEGFEIKDNDFDLGIAIGGDGAFLRMIKNTNFDSNPYYVGINSGTLGFMQEVKKEEVDKLIEEIKCEKYKIDEVGIQETDISYDHNQDRFYSLNEMIIRDKDLKMAELDIHIDGDLLERFRGDGILITSSGGSTAQNLSYGGSIVYPSFSTLQITPMGPINSKVYRTLINSVIIPDRRIITISPNKRKDLLVTVDGNNRVYEDVSSVNTSIKDKKIKYLRFSHYNFPQKINEKLLSNEI